MEKERHRGTSRLQFSKEEQMQYAPVSLKEAIRRCFTKVFMQPMPNSIIRRQKPMRMRTALCKPR